MRKININEAPTTAAIKLIGGKWKLCILWQLSQKKNAIWRTSESCWRYYSTNAL